MSDFFDTPIDELLGADTEAKTTEVDIARQHHLAELEAMRDFTPPEDKMRWPKPIGPLWKN